VSADELRQVGGLQVRRTVQQQGQFIVVFPQCFTARVDCGYNISDYINFASIDWLPVGLSASKVRKLNNIRLVYVEYLFVSKIMLSQRKVWTVSMNTFILIQYAEVLLTCRLQTHCFSFCLLILLFDLLQMVKKRLRMSESVS